MVHTECYTDKALQILKKGASVAWCRNLSLPPRCWTRLPDGEVVYGRGAGDIWMTPETRGGGLVQDILNSLALIEDECPEAMELRLLLQKSKDEAVSAIGEEKYKQFKGRPANQFIISAVLTLEKDLNALYDKIESHRIGSHGYAAIEDDYENVLEEMQKLKYRIDEMHRRGETDDASPLGSI